MKIILEHCRYAPSWEALRQVLRESMNDPEGEIIDIDRPDKSIDYHATGLYKLQWRAKRNDQTWLPITLICVAVGHRQEDYEGETTTTNGE